MVQDALSVLIGKKLFQFAVEMNLQDIGWPDRIEGRLLSLASEELMALRLSQAFGHEKVTATVRAKRYKFEGLAAKGCFILRKDF